MASSGNCYKDSATSAKTIAAWEEQYKSKASILHEAQNPTTATGTGGGWSPTYTGVEYPSVKVDSDCKDTEGKKCQRKGVLFESPEGGGKAPVEYAAATGNMGTTYAALHSFKTEYDSTQEIADESERVAKEQELVDAFIAADSGGKMKCGTGTVEELAQEDYGSFTTKLPNTEGKANAQNPQENITIQAQTGVDEITGEPIMSDITHTYEDWQNLQKTAQKKCADASHAALQVVDDASTDIDERAAAIAAAKISQDCKDFANAMAALNQQAEDRSTRVEVAMGVTSINFKEQCFLLANIFSLASYKKSLDEKPQYGRIKALPYEASQFATSDVETGEQSGVSKHNASLLAQGDPFAFVNQLTQHTLTKGEFFDMPTWSISNLQPMIRLYKIISDNKTHTETQVEMKFDSYYTPNDLSDFSNTKESRGHGVGIKSFNVSYEADNPFAIKKSIKARLVLHANTFDELLRIRTGADDMGATAEYAYIDLALKTGGYHTISKIIEAERLNPQDANRVALQNLSKLAFRLKAIVGWAMPSNKNVLMESALKDAINDSCITLNLTPTIHEFNIDEQGRVEFVLNYLAYAEDFFDQPIYNIFNDPKVTTSLISRKLRYKSYNKNCKADEVAKMREEEKEAMDEETNVAMRTLVKNMLASGRVQFLEIPLATLAAFQRDGPLGMDQGDEAYAGYFQQILTPPQGAGPDMGHFLDETSGSVGAGTVEAGGAHSGEILQTTVGAIGKTREEMESQNPMTKRILADDIQTVSFFYAADLVDVVLRGIGGTLEEAPALIEAIPETGGITKTDKEAEKILYGLYKDNFKKFRVVLGPMELVRPKTPEGGQLQTKFACMGDVPISLRYFLEWLTKKLLKKEQAIYPLPRFLNDFFNEFLKNFLNNDTCFNNIAKQSTRLGQASITSYVDYPNGPDEITATIQSYKPPDVNIVPRRLYMKDPQNEQPILNVAGSRDNNIINPGFNREMNYLIYYAARVMPSERMNGNKDEDEAQGIWHYQIGKPVGIVKTINLTKTDSPGLKEVRFEQEGYDGLQQLREMYDAKIKTYSDVSAFPGNYIYIEPAGFAPAAAAHGLDLTQFGVGGYYMIIRSQHTFGAGTADTEITAKWVAEIDIAQRVADAKEAKNLESEESAQVVPSKCSVNRDPDGPAGGHADGAAMMGTAGGMDAALKIDTSTQAPDDGSTTEVVTSTAAGKTTKTTDPEGNVTYHYTGRMQ